MFVRLDSVRLNFSITPNNSPCVVAFELIFWSTIVSSIMCKKYPQARLIFIKGFLPQNGFAVIFGAFWNQVMRSRRCRHTQIVWNFNLKWTKSRIMFKLKNYSWYKTFLIIHMVYFFNFLYFQDVSEHYWEANTRNKFVCKLLSNRTFFIEKLPNGIKISTWCHSKLLKSQEHTEIWISFCMINGK